MSWQVLFFTCPDPALASLLQAGVSWLQALQDLVSIMTDGGDDSASHQIVPAAHKQLFAQRLCWWVGCWQTHLNT